MEIQVVAIYDFLFARYIDFISFHLVCSLYGCSYRSLCIHYPMRCFFSHISLLNSIQWRQAPSDVLFVYVCFPSFLFHLIAAFFSLFVLLRCRRVKCANQKINCTSFTDKINKQTNEEKNTTKKKKKKKKTVNTHTHRFNEKETKKEAENKTHDNMMWKRLLNLCHRTLHFIWHACMLQLYFYDCSLIQSTWSMICNSVFIFNYVLRIEIESK